MTPDMLPLLLAVAADAAERHAPAVDPVDALNRARRSRRQRKGHLFTLALVGFLLLVQLDPSAALGAQQQGPVAGPAAASPHTFSSLP